EPGKAPVNPAVTANNDFALDLYGRLARDKSGKNLFFSPYSISNALAIAAEGARGETADEMGKVLRLPASTRGMGAEARLRPWNLGPIHGGLAGLNRRFEAANRPAPKAVLDKIASLRKQLEAANKRVREREDGESVREAQRLAAEINKLQAQVDRYELR